MRRVKVIIASGISSPWFGKLIFWITKNKITRNGARFLLDAACISNRVKALIFWNLYEKAEIRFVQKYLSGEYPVVELGGSLGIVSSIIAKKIGIQRLFVVEANPELVSLIEQHLRMNKKDHFEVIHAGIGARQRLFFVPGNDNTVGKVTTEKQISSVQIPVKTLGELLEEEKIGMYALVSDIEGAELSFIFDDPGALKSCKELIIELHQSMYNGQLITVEQQIRQLESIGFKIIDRHGPVIFAVK